MLVRWSKKAINGKQEEKWYWCLENPNKMLWLLITQHHSPQPTVNLSICIRSSMTDTYLKMCEKKKNKRGGGGGQDFYIDLQRIYFYPTFKYSNNHLIISNSGDEVTVMRGMRIWKDDEWRRLPAIPLPRYQWH